VDVIRLCTSRLWADKRRRVCGPCGSCAGGVGARIGAIDPCRGRIDPCRGQIEPCRTCTFDSPFSLGNGVFDRRALASPPAPIRIISPPPEWGAAQHSAVPAGMQLTVSSPKSEPPAGRRFPTEWTLWRQYALAIGAVGCALLLRFLLSPWLGSDLLFITVFVVLLPLVLLVRPAPLVAAAALGFGSVLLLFRGPDFATAGRPGGPGVAIGLVVLATLAAAVAGALSRRARLARQAAEESLRAKHAQLERITENTSALLARCTADLRYEFVNRTTAEFLRLPREQVEGRRIAEVLGPEAFGTILPYVRRVLAGETVEYETQVRYGTVGPRFMHVKYVPDRDQAGHVTGWYATVTDMTERRATEEALRQTEAALRTHQAELEAELTRRTERIAHAQRQLAAAERMAAVGTLAAGVAHDIKNVLAPLALRTDRLLVDQALSDQARGDMAVIAALLDHLRAMARNLALFARDPEHEGIEGSTELVSWSSAVKGFFEASIGTGPPEQTESDRRAWISLRWNIPAGLPAVGVAPHRLTQAVLNLVQNARDAIVTHRALGASQEAGAIIVNAGVVPGNGGQMIKLTVIDNGCGMDPATVRRSVEPFFTTKDRPSVPGGSGSGLGLTMAKAICERAGGSLHIQSEPGVGTTVTMALPRAAAHTATAATPPQHQGATGAQSIVTSAAAAPTKPMSA
jgi:PAS domain S-box-containing protein